MCLFLNFLLLYVKENYSIKYCKIRYRMQLNVHTYGGYTFIYNVEKRGMECRVCTEKRYEYTKDSAHLLYKKNSTVVLLLCIFFAFSDTDIIMILILRLAFL